jgi:hypothetical protein
MRDHDTLVGAEVAWHPYLKRFELKETLRELSKLLLIPDQPGIPEKFEEYDEPCLPSCFDQLEKIQRWHRPIPTNRVLDSEPNSPVRDYGMHALSKS